MARRSILRSRQNRIGQPQTEGIRAAGFHAACCKQAGKVCEVLIKFLQDQSHGSRFIPSNLGSGFLGKHQ
jgi:hypothetical protein